MKKDFLEMKFEGFLYAEVQLNLPFNIDQKKFSNIYEA